METFKVSESLKSMTDTYPDVEQLVFAARNGGDSARTAIARQWLSEGIPFVFKDCPALYESVRTWMAIRLDVNPKEINLTGSARLGQSLSPDKLGKPFRDSESDFDIFIISEELFKELKNDFNKWSHEFESNLIQPTNSRQKGFWKDNHKRGEKLLSKGFIDSKMVPNDERYISYKKIAQTMWLLKEKLDITQDAPKISGASVRCYKSWNHYSRQISLNLSHI